MLITAELRESWELRQWTRVWELVRWGKIEVMFEICWISIVQLIHDAVWGDGERCVVGIRGGFVKTVYKSKFLKLKRRD